MMSRFTKAFIFEAAVSGLKNILLLSLLAGLLAACAAAPTAAAPTPLPVQLTPGKSALVGTVSEAGEIWPERTLRIYAASYDGNEQGEGFYLLDTARAPQALLASGGAFQLQLPPGSYVLVVGPTGGESLMVSDENNQMRLFKMQSGQIQQLGDLRLAR